MAKQNKTGEGRFVFTNYQIKGPQNKIVFKIRSLKNWIGLGIGIRERLKHFNYRFECILLIIKTTTLGMEAI